MKTTFNFFFFIILFSHFLLCSSAYCQAPQAFPYQAVARDTSGSLLMNQTISLRFSIHHLSANGNVVYKETQNVTTNKLGLFNVYIGQGTTLSGTFASINWGNGAKFIQVEMDVNNSNNYITMGTSQIISVPYALYSAKCGDLPSGNSNGNTMRWEDGSDTWIADNTIYNDGIRVGIGGSNTEPWKLKVSGNDSAIKIRGTGLLGQYGQLNFGDANYVYLKEDADDKLLVHANRISFDGGNVGINTTTPVARLHVENDDVVFTGPTTILSSPGYPPIQGGGTRTMWYADKGAFRTGSVYDKNWDRDSIGLFSFGAGNNALAKGFSSIAIGYNSSATGDYSIALGELAKANSYHSTAIGGYTEANGQYAIALGPGSFANGIGSTSIGDHTIANSFACLSCGQYNDPITNPENTLSPTTPLFIIGNGNASSSVRSNAMVVRNNGRVGIGTNANTYQFEVSTNSAAKPSSSSWTVSSDARLKSIDGNYTKGLNDILKLNTILYHYKKDNARKLPSDEQSYGFIAQEVQKIFPECVKENEDGYLSLDMHPILVSYVNAFKDLNEMFQKQNSKISNLEDQNEQLIKRLEVLERK